MKSPSATTDASKVVFTVDLPGLDKPFEIYFRSHDVTLAAHPEAYIAATLLPAMKLGEDLSVEDPIDSRFASNLETIQNIYTSWFSESQRVRVEAPLDGSSGQISSGRTATLFSGGVDSFYTLLKHIEEIDVLVFVHGFDVELRDKRLREQVSEMLHRVSDAYDKSIIEIETNLRVFSSEHVSWKYYHGAGLASVALALQDYLDQVFVPSSFTYDNLVPWGTHPVLDPLWSTAKLEFLHDGCEVDRTEKCRVISESDVALRTLRVCWRNTDGMYNCCRCEKCMRTMVQLLAVNALKDASTFPENLDVERLAETTIIRRKAYRYEKPLRMLEAGGNTPEIVGAIQKAMREPSRLKRVLDNIYVTCKSIRRFIG